MEKQDHTVLPMVSLSTAKWCSCASTITFSEYDLLTAAFMAINRSRVRTTRVEHTLIK